MLIGLQADTHTHTQRLAGEGGGGCHRKALLVGAHEGGEVRHQVDGREVVHVRDLQGLHQRRQPVVARPQRLGCAPAAGNAVRWRAQGTLGRPEPLRRTETVGAPAARAHRRC